MKAEFQITLKKDHLLIEIIGAFDDIETKDSFITEIFESSVKHGLTNILVDARSLQGELSVFDRFEISEFMANQNIKFILSKKIKQIRLAFVMNYPLMDTRKFGETVAANRGLKILVTNDINEALEWFGLKADE